MMQTYVAEVVGRAVIAFRAKDEIEAQKWIDTEEDVRSDLAVLENEGRPLWDGETPIVVRAATFAETAVWTRKSVELSEEEGDYNPNDTLGFKSGPLRAYQAIGDLCRAVTTQTVGVGFGRRLPPDSTPGLQPSTSSGEGRESDTAAACRAHPPCWLVSSAGRSSHEERGGRYLAYGPPPVTPAMIRFMKKRKSKETLLSEPLGDDAKVEMLYTAAGAHPSWQVLPDDTGIRHVGSEWPNTPQELLEWFLKKGRH